MRGRLKVIAGVLFFIIVSCAVITVNIYFPEKEVKEAYKTLEKELMTTDKGTTGKQPEARPEGNPESSIKLEFITSAHAQETGLADKIAQIIKRMPDVVQAYKEMGSRMADIDRLRDRGAAGEANSGLLVVRDQVTPDENKLVELENENRLTVMKGMAKAIIRINRLPETAENIKQVIPQAVEQFAALRRDSAKKGCWIQDSYGNWTRK